MGKLLAKSLETKVGDTLPVVQEKFRVVGIYDTANVLDNGQGVVFLADLQRVTERPDQVTGFQITLAHELPNQENKQTAVARLRSQINELKNDQGETLGLSGLPTKDFVSSDLQVRLAAAMAWGTSVIALVIGTIGILNTMVMSVLERTREIGIRSALGATHAGLLGFLLREGLRSVVIGIVLGLAGLVWATTALKRILTQGLSGDALPMVLVLVAGMPIAAIVAAALPARRVVRESVAALLRV